MQVGEYKLEKGIWTDSDFDSMGWHDAIIYQMRIADDIELDIDYILKWNEPEIEGMSYTFWVSPATLVFKNQKNFTSDVFFNSFDAGLEISDIERSILDEKTVWAIVLQQGFMEFQSDGFEQYIRQAPFFTFGQTLDYRERGGYSLERTTSQQNLFRVGKEYIADKEKQFELYGMSKKRFKFIKLKEELQKNRDENTIELKEFLKRKREIDEELFSLDFFLKGTEFEKS